MIVGGKLRFVVTTSHEKSQVSEGKVSDFRSKVSGLRSQVSGLKSQVSSVSGLNPQNYASHSKKVSSPKNLRLET